MKIELQRWLTPNYVIGMPNATKRDKGYNPDSAPKWHISDVDAETLAEQCDKFRAEVFEKAGKEDPAKKKIDAEKLEKAIRDSEDRIFSFP